MDELQMNNQECCGRCIWWLKREDVYGKCTFLKCDWIHAMLDPCQNYERLTL